MEKLSVRHLHSEFDKINFDCGNETLNYYIQKQAGQDVKRRLSICFVLVNNQNKIKSFYTLSNAGIPKEMIPDEILKKLPKTYKQIPVILLGRLAIDNSIKGNGYGGLLLIDALKRSLNVSMSAIGSLAVIVDPINELAEKFYFKFGFVKLGDSRKMFISMRTISKLFD